MLLSIVLVWRAVFPHWFVSTGLSDAVLVFLVGALGMQVLLHLGKATLEGRIRAHGVEMAAFVAHCVLSLRQELFVGAAVYVVLVAAIARGGLQPVPLFFAWPLALHTLAMLAPSLAVPLLWGVAGGVALWRTPRNKKHDGEDFVSPTAPGSLGAASTAVELDTFHAPHLTCEVRLLDGCDSQILTEHMRDRIWEALPLRLRLRSWCLRYCFERDGAGLTNLFRSLKALNRRSHSAGCILLVKDEDGGVCGAYASTPWEPQTGSFGTGETFVFSFPNSNPSGQVFTWQRKDELFPHNDVFLMANAGDKAFLGVGAGAQGPALWLDQGLRHGSSSPCTTFNSASLTSKQAFKVVQVC